MSAIETEFNRIANLPKEQFVSEEDVKAKIILPILRALGYEEADFNFENRTGRGYVDIVVKHFPVGIVVETKAPGKNLENFIDRLEEYVFQKHTRGQATIAMLTDGELFRVYGVGVTEDLRRGSLPDYQIAEFTRSQLADSVFVKRMIELLSKEQNKVGAINEVIADRRRERSNMDERLQAIDSERKSLLSERDRINSRLQELETQRASIQGKPVPEVTNVEGVKVSLSDLPKYPAIPHILRILNDRGAFSKDNAVKRKDFTDLLVGKVDGVKTDEAVRWGLIKPRDAAKAIVWEKGLVWLK